MKQIKAHIAVSLDGFIATSDNELDWITSNVKSLIGKEYEAATCLLMGANTYTYLFEHWGGWLYKSKRTFVVHHRLTAYHYHFSFHVLSEVEYL